VTERSSRFLAIDALRGFAALAVVVYHIHGAFERAPQPWMPSWLAYVFSAGHFGVNIFFVLSGFVIAYSLRSAKLSGRFIGQFTLRRSIRLDPSLWVAIALEALLVWLSLRFFPGVGSAAMPTLPQMAANAVYLPEFLGYAYVSPVLWTLCYEIQYYLTFVTLLVAAHAIGKRFSPPIGQRVLAAVLVALFVASLAARQHLLPGLPKGLALERWSEFFCGVLTFWVVSGRAPRWLMGCAVVVLAGNAAVTGNYSEPLVTLSTAAMCAMSFLRPSTNRFFDHAALQWMGLISYSLYLFHASVGYRTVSLGQHLLGKTLSPVTGPLLWIVSLAVAIGVSAILWRLVERPSHALSRRIAMNG